MECWGKNRHSARGRAKRLTGSSTRMMTTRLSMGKGEAEERIRVEMGIGQMVDKGGEIKPWNDAAAAR